MHIALPCACPLHNSSHEPVLYPVHEVLAGKRWSQLTAEETALFSATAAWLDESISRPDPGLGRSGDVCPWTRRTLQLGRLFLASIPATEPACIDASVLNLLSAFGALEEETCPLDAFRAFVAVFPQLSQQAGDEIVVATHARLKPAFLQHRMMLGEFYPTCGKPGLHASDFRPLRSPHPMLVIRTMVEADLSFLTEQDEFVEAYLDAFGPRGLENLGELLENPCDRLPPDRLHALRRRMAQTPG